MSSCLSPSGQSVLSLEHRASAHHQAEGDPSGGVESLHESRESHPHPGASSGNSVCSASLQAGGTGLLRNIRLHHAHTDALPGQCDGLNCNRIFYVIWQVLESWLSDCFQLPGTFPLKTHKQLYIMSRPECIFSLVFTVNCPLHAPSSCLLLWILMHLWLSLPPMPETLGLQKNKLLLGCKPHYFPGFQ